MAVSQLCYHSVFWACAARLGEGGIIVVRVLPAKLVLGRERGASWGRDGVPKTGAGDL